MFFIISITFLFISACSNQATESAGAKSDSSDNSKDALAMSGDKAKSKAQEQTGPHPVITFESNKHDFGKIEQGSKVTHEFSFKNTGKEELVIENIRTTCGCTAAVTSSKTIVPDATGKISVTLDPGNLQGRISKSVIINTNDPGKRIVQLFVEALIAVDIEVKPTSLFFGHVYTDENATKQVILVDHMENRELKIKKVEFIPDPKTLDWQQSRLDVDKLQLDVTLKKGTPLGNFHSKMVIHTNSEKQPTIKVNLRADVRGDIEVRPERVSFGIIDVGTSVNRKIEIFHRKSDTFSIKKLTCNSPHLVTELKTLEKNKRYELVITVPESVDTASRISGIIELETDSKIDPLIKIPVYGVIREKVSTNYVPESRKPKSVSGKITDK
jgi:hypothetical protein